MAQVAFSCTCGALKGHLSDITPAAGTHARCSCGDCRAAEIHCGHDDPGTDGVTLFQMSPDAVHFDEGVENLGVFSFSPRGLLRWQATCCGALMFNTVRNPKVAFASLRTSRAADESVFGPVVAHAFIPAKNGKTRHEGLPRFIWGTVKRVAKGRLSGSWKNTPFFDSETLQPVVPVNVLPKGTRQELLSN